MLQKYTKSTEFSNLIRTKFSRIIRKTLGVRKEKLFRALVRRDDGTGSQESDAFASTRDFGGKNTCRTQIDEPDLEENSVNCNPFRLPQRIETQ